MTITHTHVCPLYYACEFLVAFILCLCKKYKDRKYPGITFMYGICINILTLVDVLLSQFEWKSRDSPTETRLTDRYRSTDSLSFVTPANFPCAVTVRRMANDITYTMYAALPIHLRVQSMVHSTLFPSSLPCRLQPWLCLSISRHRSLGTSSNFCAHKFCY